MSDAKKFLEGEESVENFLNSDEQKGAKTEAAQSFGDVQVIGKTLEALELLGVEPNNYLATFGSNFEEQVAHLQFDERLEIPGETLDLAGVDLQSHPDEIAGTLDDYVKNRTGAENISLTVGVSGDTVNLNRVNIGAA